MSKFSEVITLTLAGTVSSRIGMRVALITSSAVSGGAASSWARVRSDNPKKSAKAKHQTFGKQGASTANLRSNLTQGPRPKFARRVRRAVRIGQRPTTVCEEHTFLSQESAAAAQFHHNHMTITSNR